MWRHIKNSNAIYRDRVARIWVSLEVWASPVSRRRLTISIVSANRIYEPRHEKNSLLGFRPGLTQTGLYNHRIWLEA